ncbi:MAG: 2-succinyl-5-enolpyruvyl-6-hydroxy-3-cyclohexene-1-carboxylic-acid synthase [Oculatellaceae cyanobacterium Prado106]|nr:2-succinyl-5-enolpyruvyl-6-hydroxy-3-cyclohexene-1-carboxylic-acid synthase [Oculatellaceae cyanobacterium Prado106]
MSIDFRNSNTLWASVLAETLHRLGLTTAVICPGSRSASLAIAFAQHPAIEAIPILDERSAAFFALGIARRSGVAPVLVCTSGTAGANFYPAIIEARESRLPLLVLTSDRPPELRDCNAGQTIDQQKLFGTFPNWYSELSLPSPDLQQLAYLRQTILYAWERSHYPVPGVVHLNLPLRDPLAPIPQAEVGAIADRFPSHFFDHIQGREKAKGEREKAKGERRKAKGERENPLLIYPSTYPPIHPSTSRTLLIAGIDQPIHPEEYCDAIAHLSKTLNAPVLAEALSPIRNYASLNPQLVTTYDWILRDPQWAEQFAPDWVIRVGEMPTSKTLRRWLEETQPLQWVIDPGDRNLDPLHGRTVMIRRSLPEVAASFSIENDGGNDGDNSQEQRQYLQAWGEAERRVRRSLDSTLSQTETFFEGKVAWMLSRSLPPDTLLFVANSTPIRDMDWFWCPGDLRIRPFCNRGANGIDGNLSTALGIGYRQVESAVLLTGDLALLHDTNGFLIHPRFGGHLTIVLINNNGGGIFEHLPIAQFDPPFEEFFATPQNVDFAQLCATYNVKHERIESWRQLEERVSQLSGEGIRVLEVGCDRKADAQWIKTHLAAILHPHQE